MRDFYFFLEKPALFIRGSLLFYFSLMSQVIHWKFDALRSVGREERRSLGFMLICSLMKDYFSASLFPGIVTDP